MLVLDAAAVRARAPLPKLIACLREAFLGGYVVPPRQVIDASGGAGKRLLLVMPAFDAKGAGAVKLSTVSLVITQSGRTELCSKSTFRNLPQTLSIVTSMARSSNIARIAK